jgi:diguanylate cyclase (GGDEF)-like protein
MASSFGSIVADALLGKSGRQRLRVSQSALALVCYALFAVLQHVEVKLGLIDPDESRILGLLYLSGSLAFFIVMRSGLNERMASDPSLTLAQTVFGIFVSVAAYAITGPARGAVMTLLVLILVFTMFSLPASSSRALAILAFAALIAVMLWKSRVDPLRYPHVVEIIHLVFAGIVLAGVSVLAGRMGTMRERLQSQKLELTRALDRIGQLATRDELTGLFNRRHMSSLMQAEQARRRRDGSCMSIALIDIDLFKRVNDTHGHQAGDAVLKAFAEASRQVLRSTDVLARWGGEEFLLMLPATNLDQAVASVERLRTELSRMSLGGIAPGLKVTFSAGITMCDDDTLLETRIEQADQAMYRAKTNGRNRTEIA